MNQLFMDRTSEQHIRRLSSGMWRMIAELALGAGCLALGFYAVYKLSDNCILIIYRRDRDSDVTTRQSHGRRHFSLNRTVRDALHTLRERGSLNINVGSNRGGPIDGSHNWNITRLVQSRDSHRQMVSRDIPPSQWPNYYLYPNYME